MTKVFIIHGSYGHPEENWFPWLKKELEKLGHMVIVPQFPTPKGQNLDNWMKVFGGYMSKVDDDTVFVGHSIAPAFILNVLEKIDVSVRACFFVAGFTGKFPGKYADPRFDEINKTIADRDFDWIKIRNNCKRFYVFHSDNDPYVPPGKGTELAKNLGAEVILVKKAGHFNEKAGYTKFPLLLEKMKSNM